MLWLCRAQACVLSDLHFGHHTWVFISGHNLPDDNEKLPLYLTDHQSCNERRLCSDCRLEHGLGL